MRAAAFAFGLAAGWVAVTLGAYGAARVFVADGDYRVPALLATAALAVSVALVLSVFRFWRRAGFTPWRVARARALFAVPAIVVLFPLVAGFAPVDAGSVGVLVLGYALTGFAEEGFFRGIMLEVLRPLGPTRSIVLSSVLFGAVHLSNILIRGNPAVILSQAVGAACFGFGYAALRYRTGTVVPLILLHFLTDFFLQIGSLPLIPVAVAQDTLLLSLGLFILSRKGPVDVV